MEILTIEKAREMSTRDLEGITWDWYKEVTGYRPRHWDGSREEMLNFIENELKPETQELRKKQWIENEKLLTQMEEDYEKSLKKNKMK